MRVSGGDRSESGMNTMELLGEEFLIGHPTTHTSHLTKGPEEQDTEESHDKNNNH